MSTKVNDVHNNNSTAPIDNSTELTLETLVTKSWKYEHFHVSWKQLVAIMVSMTILTLSLSVLAFIAPISDLTFNVIQVSTLTVSAPILITVIHGIEHDVDVPDEM